MAKANILEIGSRWGNLTVIGGPISAKESPSGRSVYPVECICGVVFTTRRDQLVSGAAKSCGCSRDKKTGKNIVAVVPGSQWHHLTIIGPLLAPKETGSRATTCEVRCECGTVFMADASAVKSGNKRSCGCANEVQSLEIGSIWGRLTVIGPTLSGNGKDLKAPSCLVRCICGTEFVVETGRVRRGMKRSCGCLPKDKSATAVYKHGDTGSPLYNRWTGMKERCGNPNNVAYKWYGGKGIKICDEWLDYVVFKEWATTHGYHESLTIERIDPDLNYEPDNCEWISSEENTRRANIRREYTKKKQTNEN